MENHQELRFQEISGPQRRLWLQDPTTQALLRRLNEERSARAESIIALAAPSSNSALAASQSASHGGGYAALSFVVGLITEAENAKD